MSVGTIWAMERKFFFEIGGFDEKMVFWGGENVELPIRVSVIVFMLRVLLHT